MANNLGSLVVRLGLDAADFVGAMSKSDRQAQNFVKSFKTGLTGLVAVAGTAAAGITAALAFANSQADAIASFQGLSEKIGDTAVNVASLAAASAKSGTSMDSVAAASVKFTQTLSKTDDESDAAARALKALGLNMEDIKRLSPVEQMDAVAKKFAEMDSSADKSAISMALYGKSGTDLIGFLNDLGDQQTRSSDLTAEQIAAADAYSKQLGTLKGDIKMMAMTTAAEAIPSLSTMASVLQDSLVHFKNTGDASLIMNGAMQIATGGIKALSVGAAYAVAAVVNLGKAFAAYEVAKQQALRGNLAGAKATMQSFFEDYQKSSEQVEAFRKKVYAPAPAVVTPKPALIGPLPGVNNSFSLATPKKDKAAKAPKAASTAESEFARYLDGLKKQERAVEQLGAYEKTLDDIRQGRIGKLTGAQETQLLNIARETDLRKLLQKQAEESDDARKRMLEDGLRLTEAMRNPQQIYNDELQRLNSLLQAAAVSQDTYALAVSQAQDKFVKDSKRQTDEANALSETGQKVSDAFSGGFDRMIRDGERFQDTIKNIAKELLLMQLQKSFLKPASDALGGLFGGGGGGGGDWLTGILGFDGGGSTGNGARAGGLDGKGGFLAMMHPKETVIDHTKGQSARGGVTLVQNVSVDARGADASVALRIAAAMEQTKQETLNLLMSNINSGGDFAYATGRAE